MLSFELKTLGVAETSFAARHAGTRAFFAARMAGQEQVGINPNAPDSQETFVKNASCRHYRSDHSICHRASDAG